jgi:hypothetical protein
MRVVARLGQSGFGVSHQADLHLGQIRGAGAFAPLLPRLPALAFLAARAIHSWPQRSHRKPGTLIVIVAIDHQPTRRGSTRQGIPE